MRLNIFVRVSEDEALRSVTLVMWRIGGCASDDGKSRMFDLETKNVHLSQGNAERRRMEVLDLSGADL